MNRVEVLENIGTVAKSGRNELRKKMQADSEFNLSLLIGELGVGFYSAFMVADKVTLLTRRAGQNAATLWESTVDGLHTPRGDQA
jgi:molecular chaperone HtpG